MEALQQGTVLLVDDQPANLAVLMNLRTYGYRLLTARDGATALARAVEQQPELILLDVMMPEMDGFEVCRRLKADPATADIPIIFMTALSDTTDKVKGFQAGAVDYVVKPFQFDEVVARVRAHLTLHRLLTEMEMLVAARTVELQQANATLERLDAHKSDFIQIAAHELRTPLTIIKGYTQLLRRDATPEQMDRIAGILAGVERMQAVAESMLDVARIDEKALPVHLRTTTLAEICRPVLDDLALAVVERNLTVTLAVDTTPPFNADPVLLRKAMEQLLSNALKYTPDGGQITVQGQVVTGNGNGPELELVVADSGIGIDPAVRELIFEKFYQTGEVAFHSSSRTKFKGGGPGLGLAITRGIIAAHGGQIWAESPGYDEVACPGSRFIIRLPLTSGGVP